MDSPEGAGVVSLQWLFGAGLAAISAIVGYLFNWNTRIEQKIEEAKNEALRVVDEQRREFKNDLDKSLARQTNEIIRLMDARLYQMDKIKRPRYGDDDQ